MAIRGTEVSSVDYLQDAKLVVLGFANDQLISLYRYYRRLTTPGGEPVRYTSDEIALLRALNSPIAILGGTNVELDGLLASDRGIFRTDGLPGRVLLPADPLIVTGHSLGGHLAILFGRLFPGVTQDVYTFNAPGIAPWGNVLLTNAGVGPSDPAHVVNIVADYGENTTSAYGVRPGRNYRAFIEGSTSAVHNHSIVQLTDSLALYDVIAKLSPGLEGRLDEISSILAAASRRPGDSLERTLDMLRKLVGFDEAPTPVALEALDQANRDAYYTRLYEVRDDHASRDWMIGSLVGVSGDRIAAQARSDPAYRYALAELMPFIAIGAPERSALAALSGRWLDARGEFLQRLTEARVADRMFALSGGSANSLFVDVDRAESLAVLGPQAALVAQNQGTEARLAAYLDGISYGRKTIFGSDDASAPDSIAGTSGNDALFGNAGADTLRGGAGEDVLDGGAGADTLEGGAGNDVYAYGSTLDGDTIRDSDGRGFIEVAGVALDGGVRQRGDSYLSADGTHRYVLSGDVLRIDDTLTVEGFHDGDLGIRLADMPRPPTRAAPGLDLLGDIRMRDGSTPGAVVDRYNNPIPIGGAAPGQHDLFFGLPGETAISTQLGTDYVHEDWGGNDYISLGDGTDFAWGGEGNDWIFGDAAPDMLLGGPGDDVLFAESADTDIDAPSPYLFDSNADAFRDDLLGGQDGNDVLVGSGRADFVEGGPGEDILIGGAGNDVLLGDGTYIAAFGEPDADRVLNPETGTPFVLDHAGVGGVITFPRNNFRLPSFAVDFFDDPGAGADTIFGGPGVDYILGGSADDIIHGGAGNDVIDGGAGADTIYTEPDGATVYGDGAPGWHPAGYDPEAAGGDDRIVGDGTLYGQGGDDYLEGAAANDTLEGGAGADRLIAGWGDDVLAGGLGEDLLDGGPGSDTYRVGTGDTLEVRFGETGDALTPDGAFPTSATVHLSAGFALEDLELQASVYLPGVVLLRLQPDAHYDFRPTAGFLTLQGTAADWSGLRFEFADGTSCALGDLPRREIDSSELFSGFSPFGTAGDDLLVAAVERDLAGGAGGDLYVFAAGGGRGSIEDTGGEDLLILEGVRSDEVSAYRSGEDYLLRYRGGEVRLVGQADADGALEAISFTGDGVWWDAAALAAHASPAPALHQSALEAQVAHAGEAFEFRLPAALFAEDHVVGDPRYVATDLRGGELPAWLHFDAESGVLSGTPGAGDIGVAAVALALRDGDEIIAIEPLVIAVQGDVAAAAPAGSPPPLPPLPPLPSVSSLPELASVPTLAMQTLPLQPASEPALSAPPPATPVDAAAPEASAIAIATPQEPPSASGASDIVAVVAEILRLQPTAPPTRASVDEAADVVASPPEPGRGPLQPAASAAVGESFDPGYRQIESLLFAPAATHATSFVERYVEAVREFRERFPTTPEAPPAPLPTDEEMGAYNAALHAWLDEDGARLRALHFEQAWDAGTLPHAWLGTGEPLERLQGASGDVFARPGLPAPAAIAAQPGLREGLPAL